MVKFVYALVISILFTSCIFNFNSKNTLQPLNVFSVNITEPSGITFYNNYLYIVSDSKKVIYKTNLQGEIVDKIKVSTSDNEGVCLNSNGNLVVVSESKRRLIEIDASKDKEIKYSIKGKQKQNNSGLEGVCFVPLEKSYFLVNEKSPKQLLKVSNKGKITKEIKINFAEDLSGICFDEDFNLLWLVSDESKTIINIDLNGKLIKSYPIPIVKAEGITIGGNKIYVVSDEENKLYVFDKPI